MKYQETYSGRILYGNSEVVVRGTGSSPNEACRNIMADAQGLINSLQSFVWELRTRIDLGNGTEIDSTEVEFPLESCRNYKE